MIARWQLLLLVVVTMVMQQRAVLGLASVSAG
jgi:hypothetical protein